MVERRDGRGKGTKRRGIEGRATGWTEKKEERKRIERKGRKGSLRE